jgi:hypothetical protein
MAPATIEPPDGEQEQVPPPSYISIGHPIPPPNNLPLAYHYDYYRQLSVPKPEDIHQPRPAYPPPRYTPRQTGEFVCYVNPVDHLELEAQVRRQRQRYAIRSYAGCLAIFTVIGLISVGISKAAT